MAKDKALAYINSTDGNMGKYEELVAAFQVLLSSPELLNFEMYENKKLQKVL